MSDYEEIEDEIKHCVKKCASCINAVGGKAAPRTDDRSEGTCWTCNRILLSNWEVNLRYNDDEWMERLITTKHGYEKIELGVDPITKNCRPKFTQWKQTTIHKDIKTRMRSKRRIFKQYLKTGSLRLLKAAEKKITSWDFD